MKKSNENKKQQKEVDKVLMQELNVDKDGLKKLKKKLLKAESRPERGIETWFRLASKNLYTRLQIIDTKANILITANAIIISVVLGTLYSRLEDDPHLVFAVSGMLITNVLSITFAILAAIPRAWKTNQKDHSPVDLMTFDDFSTMSLEKYRASVLNVMESGDVLYPSIIADIYTLGVTLARKYKLIRISFKVFLYGIIISLILFGLCHLVL